MIYYHRCVDQLFRSVLMHQNVPWSLQFSHQWFSELHNCQDSICLHMDFKPKHLHSFLKPRRIHLHMVSSSWNIHSLPHFYISRIPILFLENARKWEVFKSSTQYQLSFSLLRIHKSYWDQYLTRVSWYSQIF